MTQAAGKVVVISGPSGVGKGTVIQKVIELDPSIRLAVSATTRAPRDGEIPGQTYHFLDAETFDRKVKNMEFAEYCEVHGNYYGTLRSELEGPEHRNDTTILEIDVEGAAKLQHRYEGLLTIFIAPPSFHVLTERLTGRKTDSEGQIRGRLQIAKRELRLSREYDYVVINQDIVITAQEILQLIDRYKGDDHA